MDLDGNVVDMVLKAKEEAEAVEANVGVNGEDGEAEMGKGEADIGGGGSLSDVAVAGGDDNDVGCGA